MLREDFLFEKRQTLRIDATSPEVVSVRPSESLEIVRCAGEGQLLASVSDSSNRSVVEKAVCYDSAAFFSQPAQLDHVLIKDAATSVLVELHVEHTASIVVDIKQTFRFTSDERRL